MIEASLPFDNHRSTPLASVAPFVDALRANSLDYFWIWDELSGWFPNALWNPANTGLAAIRDAHSTHDPFLLAAVAAAHDSKINLRLTTDALRNHPVDTMRKMLVLAAATEGRAVIAVGVGELRQTKPFGYRRAEGLDRYEDAFRIWTKLQEADEPFDFEGKFWNMKNAYIGKTRPRRPEFWALGGGPRLLQIAAKYADGFETGIPASATPEKFADQVKYLRSEVERNGRDPSQFGFGVWLACAIHEDPEVIERAFENPILKFYAAMYGRFNRDEWAREGVPDMMPEGYHYATKYLPFDYPDVEVERVVSQVPRKMVERSFYTGSPAEVAKTARDLKDAGATFVGILDLMPLVQFGKEAPEGFFNRACKVSSLTKG